MQNTVICWVMFGANRRRGVYVSDGWGGRIFRLCNQVNEILGRIEHGESRQSVSLRCGVPMPTIATFVYQDRRSKRNEVRP